MAGYESNSKILESYQTLAKLLSTDKKENIDKTYDALKAIAEQDYKSALAESEASYSESRDTLALNRAKSEKYMNYFLTEGGYEGSGIAADAKIKSDISYREQQSALNREEQESRDKLLTEKNQALYDIESKRASEQSEADTELAELEYKVASEQADRELRLKELESSDYWKRKDHELQAAVSNATVSSDGSFTVNGESYGSIVEGYRTLLYNDIIDSFNQASTSDEMQGIYDSVAGVNTENSVKLFGEEIYKKMVKEMQNKITAKKKSEKYNEDIRDIVRDLIKSGDAAMHVYGRYCLTAMHSHKSRYTLEQVQKALEIYKDGVRSEIDLQSYYIE